MHHHHSYCFSFAVDDSFCLQDKAVAAASDQVSSLCQLILKISLTREIRQGLEMRVQMKSRVPLQSLERKVLCLECSERFDILERDVMGKYSP